MAKNKKIIVNLIFLLAVFGLAVLVWYAPVIFKGYPSQLVGQEMLLAKNYYQTGILAFQNDQNVTLAPGLIKTEGHTLPMSQYLGVYLSAKIFNLIGLPGYPGLLLFSIVLYALALLFFAALILYLYNLKTALIFSLFYIFSPISLALIDSFGEYDFCLVFLALFFIFYFWALKRHQKSVNKLNYLFYIAAGLFLALSALANEITFVVALAVFIFLAIKKQWQTLMSLGLSFVALIVVFWLPSIFSGQNSHLNLFTSRANEEAIFTEYLHVFPDPYTYYFEKEAYLAQYKNQNEDLVISLETRKALANFNLGKITLLDRLKVSAYIFFQHLSRFFSLEDFGGPLVSLLLLAGLAYLRKKDQFFYQLSLYWLGLSLLIFSFGLLVSRNHLMDFVWLMALLPALGLIYLVDILKEYFKLSAKKTWWLSFLMVALMAYHLVLVDHVVLGDQYDVDFVPKSLSYAEVIKGLAIQDNEVIAIPEDFSGQQIMLNYLTDKSFIIFRPATLEKLLKANKAKEALSAFRVKYVLGYSSGLTEELVKQAEVVNIADASWQISLEEVSENKGFLLNIIR